MYKLLIEENGHQRIEKIGYTGSYYDMSLVIWDERVHGSLGDVVLGGIRRTVVDDAPAIIVDAPAKAIHDSIQSDIDSEKDIQDILNNRRNEYPSVGDQLDAIYKKLSLGNSTEYDAIAVKIAAVKTKHPKP